MLYLAIYNNCNELDEKNPSRIRLEVAPRHALLSENSQSDPPAHL